MAAKTLRTKIVEFANRAPLIAPIWRNYRSLRTKEYSPFDNIYHCCTQKTASQWFRGVFADPLFTDHTGLVSVPFIDLGLADARIDEPLDRGTIGTHLYIDYPTYRAIPKPESYRTFFVMRDPRDLIVSWYFSARYSHPLVRPVDELRPRLESLEFEDGMIFLIDKLHEYGTFTAQLSWMEADGDRHVRLMRYEDLAADNRAFLAMLLDYLKVPMSSEAFETLYARNNFQTLTGPREQGDEDIHAHNRKGVAGDWRNHFTDRISAHFHDVMGDGMARLGYH
ncbi:MAG: sulfotransferase domain-containing protein [Geminicoccaceae bacterium]|nr:sulfotransferase domain-containing protein [Geminicoccaceae bacterium]MCB9941995.1 sulfotransferase domain-containing protein [Geminicoccaceae bacterium]